MWTWFVGFETSCHTFLQHSFRGSFTAWIHGSAGKRTDWWSQKRWPLIKAIGKCWRQCHNETFSKYKSSSIRGILTTTKKSLIIWNKSRVTVSTVFSSLKRTLTCIHIFISCTYNVRHNSKNNIINVIRKHLQFNIKKSSPDNFLCNFISNFTTLSPCNYINSK